MIAKLTGIVEEFSEDRLVLNVGGIGFALLVAQPHVFKIGHHYTFSTHMAFKQDGVDIYGFPRTEEKACFALLLSVQGVGGRIALSLLSHLTHEEIFLAISNQDPMILTQADGVGSKLAERIVRELKGKKILKDLVFSKVSSPSLFNEGVSALINLGYGDEESRSAIMQGINEGCQELENLLTSSLAHLSKHV